MSDTVPGPLVSIRLRGNTRLQACAQTDPAHVTPREPPALHVKLINDSLRQIAKDRPGQGFLAVPEAAGSTYTDDTRKAVLALKTKFNLVTRGTSSTIDPTVGINTIRKIDQLLAERDPKPPIPPLPNRPPRLVLSGQCQTIGTRLDNPGADDMKFGDGMAARKSAKSVALTLPLIATPDIVLEQAMVAAMAAAVAITAGIGPANAGSIVAANQCVQDFFSRGGVERVFTKTSSVADLARIDSSFGIFVDKVRDQVRREVRKGFRAGLIDDRAIAAAIRVNMDAASFGTGSFASVLTAMIGGFQGYKVEMCGLAVDIAARNFAYRLDMEIFDHFGVDEDDINKPGAFGVGIGATMLSFFVLQHDRAAGLINNPRKKYRPFRIRLQVDVGPFTDNIA